MKNRFFSTLLVLLLAFTMLATPPIGNVLASPDEATGAAVKTQTGAINDETGQSESESKMDVKEAADKGAAGEEVSADNTSNTENEASLISPEGDESKNVSSDANSSTTEATSEAEEKEDPYPDSTGVGEDEVGGESAGEADATPVKQTVAADDAMITAEYGKDLFEEAVTLQAEELKAGTDEFKDAEASAHAAEGISDRAKALFAYDIKFVTADGDEIEPSDDVKVTITFEDAPAEGSCVSD